MATNLVPPTPKYRLPVSKGGDLVFDFRRKVPDSDPVSYTNYDAGTEVNFVLQRDVEVTIAATVSTSHAVVKIDNAVADTLLDGETWRLVVTFPDGTDVVAANGDVKRYDG